MHTFIQRAAFWDWLQEYTVGGDTMFRPFSNDSWEWVASSKWQAMRSINSPGSTSQNGDNHYGMSDYYPWNPDGRGCAVGGTLNVPPQGQQALVIKLYLHLNLLWALLRTQTDV